jgi:LPS-assembly lipoprotein
MTSKARRLHLLCAIGALALSACGFYLKGQRPLPLELSQVYIDYQPKYEVVQTPLESEIREQLTRRGAKVIDDPATATSKLSITKLNETRRVQSVGQTGKAIEYLLVTTVDFEFRVGKTLRVPSQSLTVQRDYSFDETQILAKEAERERRQQEMQEELASLILLRVDSALSHPAATAAPAN